MKLIVSAGALAISLTAVGVAAAQQPAQARESFSYGPFIQDCGSFLIQYQGQVDRIQTTYYDKNGNPVRLVMHSLVRETDVNVTTDESLDVRAAYTDEFDLVTGTETLNGQVFMANEPGSGAVFQDTGRIVFGPNGDPVIRGPHEVFETQTGIICDALS
jgi:hypothetical protein